tara:strand:+ start:1136 stop:2662 length:1527 start_codon:yes stop_codon:yes gene_type:complete
MLDHLGLLPSYAAQKFDNKEALIFENHSFTYNEVNSLVENLASNLKSLGIKEKDVITLYASNSWEWIISYFGIARVGAVINPVNTMLTSEEIKYVVNDCKAKAIITSSDKVSEIIKLKETGQINFIVSFNDSIEGSISFNDLINNKISPIDMPNVSSETLSTIGYTSGTTGHPKGAMQSHRAVILNGSMTSQMHMRNINDVVVSALPCPHVYGNVVMTGMMMFGTKLILHKLFDVSAIFKDIEYHKATIFDGVPTMFMYMIDHPDFKLANLSSLKRCYVGGQTMPVTIMENVEKKFKVPLIELWGMTEIAGLGSTHPLYGKNKHGSIGCAMPYCELKIADIDDPTKEMPVGEVGELMVKGPITMMGYFGDTKRTNETLEKDGWLHSGDLAKIDNEGYYYIVDRKKDMILTAGYNVYPAEIERVLAKHSSISIAAVGKENDKLKGEIAKAYVVLKENEKISEEELINFCKTHLAAYKCPRKVIFVDDVPKTSSGKIMRRELYKLDKQQS